MSETQYIITMIKRNRTLGPEMYEASEEAANAAAARMLGGADHLFGWCGDSNGWKATVAEKGTCCHGFEMYFASHCFTLEGGRITRHDFD